MSFAQLRPPRPPGRCVGWKSRIRFLTLCFLLASPLASRLAAQGKPARVAIVLDRASPLFQPVVDLFQTEVRGFFRPGEIELLPPITGDGTVGGVAEALKRAFNDPSVSVVVALGAVGSYWLTRSGSPPKPAIAAAVIDAAWQNAPQKDGASGVPRLAYVDQSYPVGSTLADFHRLIPFRKLAVLLDRDLLAIPQLEAKASELVRSVGAEPVIVPGRDSAAPILAALPADVDAAYLTPLPSMSERELAQLLAGLNARRIATLSYVVDPDLRLGALASYEPPENWRRRARRVAVDLQRILAGEDAGTLPVKLVSAPRLTLNLATARLIGFSPGWSLLTEADLVQVDSAGPRDTLTLAASMQQAFVSNLDVAAANLEVASGEETVRLARSNLLPQVDSRLTGTYTRKETAQASLGQQPERLLDGGISGFLPLYSEQAWAGYSSQRSLQEARVAQRDQLRLDVVLDAATTYLDVLRLRTVADVQRSNLYRSLSNLEVARLREGVGTASRADVYRWQSEVATARQDLIEAETQVRVASLALKRILNRPLQQPLAQEPVSFADPALLAQDSTVLTWFGEPARFAALTDFLVDEALNLSPELAQVDAAIAAQERQRTAAGRAFWLPDLTLDGGLNNVFSRGGAGATLPPVPPQFGGVFDRGPDLSWQVRLQAALPLFTGFRRIAARSQTSIDLDRLHIQREGINQDVTQRILAAMENAASSYAAIALTRDAAEAGDRNYELVSDAYAGGTASITALLDAQSAALSSSRSAANAINNFLLDLMRVERAMGNFGVLEPSEQREAFLQRLRDLVAQPQR